MTVDIFNVTRVGKMNAHSMVVASMNQGPMHARRTRDREVVH